MSMMQRTFWEIFAQKSNYGTQGETVMGGEAKNYTGKTANTIANRFLQSNPTSP